MLTRGFLAASLILLGLCAVGGVIFLAGSHREIPGLLLLSETSRGNQARSAERATTSLQASAENALPSEKLNLPILVYHIVRPRYPSDDRAVRAIALTPGTFDAQMKYLRTAGYHVVPFRDLEAYFRTGAPLPSKPIILSFDDGWSDQFAYAFPILVKYHYPATFFVFTNVIGRRGFLSWDELCQLLAAGMTIGDHTRSHPYLTDITNRAALWDEIEGSKKTLEKHLGVTINEFAYPFGAYNPAIRALVKKAGYRSARGDYFSGEQAANRLYDLSAMNAPTTTALFEKKF